MIHICVPAHNEERTVGVLLWKIRNVMADFGRGYRVLVVDDGSTDGTPEVLNRYRSSLPLTVLREERRIGYPFALERLLRKAVHQSSYPKRDSVVTLQADFTDSPDYIVPLVKTLEGGADIVAGCVETDGSAYPSRRRLTRWAATVLLGQVLRSAPVSDPLCGYRAYRVIVLKKALRTVEEGKLLSSDGWAANLELLGALAPHARRIEDAPLSERHDLRTRHSRFRPVHTVRSLYRVGARDLWTRTEGTA